VVSESPMLKATLAAVSLDPSASHQSGISSECVHQLHDVGQGN